ncbi:MAG: ATP-grasp fold amidoligase family protein [Alteraurantiacibacter sp.]
MDLALQPTGESLAPPCATAVDPLAKARVALTYWWRHGRWPRLTRPQAFTEWVQWRKLNDRDLGLARLTDKSHAKALAASLLGPGPIIPTLWRGTALPEQPPAPLPLVVKANHGCNQYRVIRTMSEWRAVREVALRWMATTYGGWLDEWHYGAATKALIIEPFVSSDGDLPRDYKIYVFGGRAACVQVHLNRVQAHRWMQFDRDWALLSRGTGALPRAPTTLAKMLAAAEAVAGERDFLRVDFYEVDGQMLFGETCLFPGSGLDPFDPPELDLLLGRHWAAAKGSIFWTPDFK